MHLMIGGYDNDKRVALELPAEDKTIDDALHSIGESRFILNYIEVDNGESSLCENLQEELSRCEIDRQGIQELNLLAYLIERMDDGQAWSYSVNESCFCSDRKGFINIALFALQDEVWDKDEFGSPYTPDNLAQMIDEERAAALARQQTPAQGM